ncbi:hypothetical protein QFC22_001524 [Naganishia vaughanmartiniae]|uniref:Uncharacterized protein n=1 Tax=Naganishia vaughanmartiniae TaxID=1424756 RepID=A0ACC2XH24_9TREE|nr:hypothetical protein QFC22_001524 [Naganishia vaughanmartiniae]
MTAIPYEPDLSSPTNRDSTASAIFNLYGYSNRDSVIESTSKREIHNPQPGLYDHPAQNASERHTVERVEELQSPRMAEERFHENRSRPSSQSSRRASSIVQASSAFSQDDRHVNGVDSAEQSYVVLGAPVVSEPPITTERHHKDTHLDGSAADDILQNSSTNEPSNRPPSAQSAHSRQSQRSLRLAEPSRQSTSGNNSPSPPPRQEYNNGTEALQLPDLSQSSQEQGTPTTSLTNYTFTRQPGEEEDAYHVRATYARLEAQGVFGDGWEEGVERTRERAVMSKRRESRAPLARSDILVEEERKALAKVDRYGFFDQALKTRQENRVYRIPAQAYRKVPKVPQRPPKRTKVERGGADMMAGGSEDTTGAVPESISPQEIERLGVSRREMFRQKEAERVGKWERMLLVAARDRGGNAAKWKWEDGGKGAKIRQRVYKGIPDRWRSAAWTALTDAKSRGFQSRGRSQPDDGALLEKYRVSSPRPPMKPGSSD